MSSRSSLRGLCGQFALLFSVGSLVGCSQGTAVSNQPTTAELQQADQRRAASVDDRKDLTPAQKEALRHRYTGAPVTSRGEGAPK